MYNLKGKHVFQTSNEVLFEVRKMFTLLYSYSMQRKFVNYLKSHILVQQADLN
jgi:hypothetical protein